jgi:hydantoinase/carbamoylase family amidase
VGATIGSSAVLHVDRERLRADFAALAAIGATPAGGVHRPALGEAHLEARAWFLDRARAARLVTRVDPAGNHSALLRASADGARTLLLGSHLDSVADGGAYDGALGVLAALEVLRTVQEAGLELPVTLEAIDFTDEEGTLVGLLGSRALAGTLTPGMLGSPRGGREALLAGLERAGLHEGSLGEARRDPATLAGYVELHIEQGPVLEREGADVAVVTTMAGSRSFLLEFTGSAAHAGTTPMEMRSDAGLAAARFAAAAHDVTVGRHPGCVATVGRIELEPGQFNIVPGRARVALEFRAATTPELDALERDLLGLARAQCLPVESEPVGRWEPCELDVRVRAAGLEAATELGLRAVELPSWAGHDAEALAAVTASGMLFVPSRGGVSHAPAEFTSFEECANGADLLLGTALRLAGEGG